MQQIIQNIRSGKLNALEVPDPIVKPGHVLIVNTFSVISAGTEKTVIDLGKKSLLAKAKERPDQVRRVLEKWRHEGFFNTLTQVREKLNEPMPMGYSSAGVVLAVGAGVQEFNPGDRVASNGPHAGVVCVPKYLCAHVPDRVPFDHAAFTVLGAIALQGVRLAQVGLGDNVFVVGLGLIGQLTVALLKANGCRVIGTDLDSRRCDLALKMGADVARTGIKPSDVIDSTRGLGADAVLITASTKSDGPVELAGETVRKKGRVVAVGAVGLNLPRRPYYFKEAEFVVSCSYGPGRYDPEYEERGHDYPPAYVRWTEQRNMQAVIELMASGKLDVSPLISHRFKIENAEEAYDLIEKGKEPFVGILIEYDDSLSVNGYTADRRKILLKRDGSLANQQITNNRARPSVSVGVIGAGNFARMTLLPILKKSGNLRLRTICSAGGLSALHTGEKLGFEVATTDEDEVINDEQVNAVFILTRHNQHARQVIKALKAGKHVFVEKPLCINEAELHEIRSLYDSLITNNGAPYLMVGFNRRFSPAAVQVKRFFSYVASPLSVLIRFNAGVIPVDHWTQDEEVGGGRIIGEACHAIDLATYLTGSLPVRVFAESIGGLKASKITDDQCFITLRHANGSISNIGYLAGGDKAFPKERIEVFGGGKVAVIDDFKEVITSQNGRTKKKHLGGQDKGHHEEIAAFTNSLMNGGPPPIPYDEIYATTLASTLAVRSIREGIPFDLFSPDDVAGGQTS